MNIVSFHKSLPITDPDSLLDLTVETPKPGPRDLLVEVRAISVNPVDAKIRSGGGPGRPDGQLQILGWDAAGVVTAVGTSVTLFKTGDEAAALPLTTITAWESLFDRMKIRRDPANTGSLLIVGGAGGVGSIAIQLARCLTGLTVIATASRPETQTWCREMGAHHVIDYRQPLAAQVKAIVPGGVNYVLALTKAEDHFDEIIAAMAPQSALALIENLARPVDINKLKPKCISVHWEFMFARARFETADMDEQGRLLNEVARLVDAGQIRTTMRQNLGLINATNLKRAHALIGSGTTVGKIVLAGF
jgi:NADPH:quinone reductase